MANPRYQHAMADRESDNLTHVVYCVEGEPYVGTVKDYAEAWKSTHYAGMSISDKVYTFACDGTPKLVTPRVTWSPYNEDDYATVTIEFEFVNDDPEQAFVLIDGRA